MANIILREKMFHLQTAHLSYLIGISRAGHLLHLYFGEKLPVETSGENLFPPETSYGCMVDYSEKLKGYQPEVLRFEYPGFGKGDFRGPAYRLEACDGNRVFDFLFAGHRVEENLLTPEGMPGMAGTGKTLIITLKDSLSGLEIELFYGLPEEADAVGRFARVKNYGKGTVFVDHLASCSLDFEPGNYDKISLDGQWIRERHKHRSPVVEGQWSLASRKGISSPDHSPFMVLCDGETGENAGRAWGGLLIYSGNHRVSLEKSPHEILRMQQGLNDETFRWKLDAGGAFDSPMALLTATTTGLNDLSGRFHRIIRETIVRGVWQKKPRPILINNWEATYFDFNERKLLKLADEAAAAGIELFVLDDGWFGKRSDDRSSLGDWTLNKQKLPGGLRRLAEKIQKKGLDFGLWVEPEMISIDSDLYRSHPDWLMRCPGREPSPGRHQYLLDLGRTEIVDYLINTLSELFSSAPIHYIKWDMNRSLTDVFNLDLEADRQGEAFHRYVLGLYRLLDTLVGRFPDILFESCASGGSRFDPGITAYMPQAWTSDDTDAAERVLIQDGSSLWAPPSIMGAHVSEGPNHQVIRWTSLESRYNTAAFGLLGYELDLTRLSSLEKKMVRKQVLFYKEHRDLLQFGRFYRIPLDEAGNRRAWMVVDKTRSKALLGYYQRTAGPNPPSERIRLVGLDSEAVYRIASREQFYDIKYFGQLINHNLPVDLKVDGTVYKAVTDHYSMPVEKTRVSVSGAQLMNIGFRPVLQFAGTGLDEQTAFVGDFGSRLYVLERV